MLKYRPHALPRVVRLLPRIVRLYRRPARARRARARVQRRLRLRRQLARHPALFVRCLHLQPAVLRTRIAGTDALNWSGANEYRATALSTWEVDGEPAGMWRGAGGLTFATIHAAGHMVSHRSEEPLLFTECLSVGALRQA